MKNLIKGVVLIIVTFLVIFAVIMLVRFPVYAERAKALICNDNIVYCNNGKMYKAELTVGEYCWDVGCLVNMICSDIEHSVLKQENGVYRIIEIDGKTILDPIFMY